MKQSKSKLEKEQKQIANSREALLKKLAELDSKEKAVKERQIELDDTRKSLRSALEKPENLIAGAKANSDFLAEALRGYFKIDKSIPDDIILGEFQKKVGSIKKSPMSDEELAKELDKTEKRVKRPNPLSNLPNFDFVMCNESISVNADQMYRQKTKSPDFSYMVKDGVVVHMSTGDNKDVTSCNFNRWKLADCINENNAKKFIACDQTTHSEFLDTLNTLNPNVVILRTKENGYYIIDTASGSYKDVYARQTDLVNGVNRYMTTLGYLSTLMVALKLYFGDRFTKPFASIFNKYSEYDIDTLNSKPELQNYLIYKYFKVCKYAYKDKSCITKGKVGGYLYVSGERWDLKKRTINKYVWCLLNALFTPEEVDEFCNSLEFYGVFDEIAQGDYKTNKEKYFHSF